MKDQPAYRLFALYVFRELVKLRENKPQIDERIVEAGTGRSPICRTRILCAPVKVPRTGRRELSEPARIIGEGFAEIHEHSLQILEIPGIHAPDPDRQGAEQIFRRQSDIQIQLAFVPDEEFFPVSIVRFIDRVDPCDRVPGGTEGLFCIFRRLPAAICPGAKCFNIFSGLLCEVFGRGDQIRTGPRYKAGGEIRTVCRIQHDALQLAEQISDDGVGISFPLLVYEVGQKGSGISFYCLVFAGEPVVDRSDDERSMSERLVVSPDGGRVRPRNDMIRENTAPEGGLNSR